MWSRVWNFLLNKGNRRTLAFVSAGLAVIAGGLWTALTVLKEWERAELLREQEQFVRAWEELRPQYRQEPRRKIIGILETGYSLLKNVGGEEQGYGLYSYAIVVNDNGRSAKFLRDAFKTIPRVDETAAQRFQTNIFYIPFDKKKAELFIGGDAYELITRFEDVPDLISDSSAIHIKRWYNYKVSRTLLDHLCDSPAEEIWGVCEGDLSRGPYVFTYRKPASKLSPVPPPFLFMDLSEVHERAFPEIIAAFRAQVKRDDISDRAKIDTLRLKLLSIVLTAADFVAPVQKAMADIVHTAGGRSEGDKNKLGSD